MKAALISGTEGKQYLKIKIPGPTGVLLLPVITHGSRRDFHAWTWNGSVESPDLKPSLLTTLTGGIKSHVWVNDGQVIFLPDSTDGYAGKTLPLEDLNTQNGTNERPLPGT